MPEEKTPTDEFVARDSRVLYTGHVTFLGDRIAVANPAGFDLDSHRSRTGFRDLSLHQFKRSTRMRDLRDTHFRHTSSAQISNK